LRYQLGSDGEEQGVLLIADTVGNEIIARGSIAAQSKLCYGQECGGIEIFRLAQGGCK
jgi:hypothetical protein